MNYSSRRFDLCNPVTLQINFFMMFFNCFLCQGLQEDKNTDQLLYYRVCLSALHQTHQVEIFEAPLRQTLQDYEMNGHQETWAILIANKKSNTFL